MRIENSKFLAFATLIALAVSLSAQQAASPQGAANQGATTSAAPKPGDTEVYEPVPPVVTPGASNSAPPSDAIVLFDGKNLDEWPSPAPTHPWSRCLATGVLPVKAY